MKKLIYSLMLCLVATVFTGCEDETSQDQSIVTYYATIELKGDEFIILNVGDTYTEPGYVATEGEDDITDKVEVKGTVKTNTPGFYSLVYTATNVDGFSVNASREVMVADPNNFASTYLGECELGARHYFDAPINITDNGDGTYTIDDVIGGFQFNGLNPGFEPTYDFHADAIIKLEADNTITLVSVGSWYFEDSVILSLNSGKYDPATGTIHLNVQYGNSGSLLVTLTK